MTEWEYFVVSKPLRGFLNKEISPEAELNKLGKEEWELVSVVMNTVNQATFFFKRLKKK